MSSMRDWYRYVKQVSRPARRAGDADARAAETLWRPWKDAPMAEAPEETLRADEIPDLSQVLGQWGTAEARQPATPEFLDPTIYDEIQPAPQFEVPELKAPSFELEPPRFAEQALAPPAGPSAVEEEEDETADDETGDDELVTRISQTRYYQALLSRQQDKEAEADAETREELVGRLLDPALTLRETARLLNVCPATVRRYTNRGVLKHFRTKGNQRRFRLSDVLEFMEKRLGEEGAEGA